MAVVVIKNRCPQNHPCPAVKVCPEDALSQKGFEAPVVEEEKCIDCGICVDACRPGALQLEKQIEKRFRILDFESQVFI